MDKYSRDEILEMSRDALIDTVAAGSGIDTRSEYADATADAACDSVLRHYGYDELTALESKLRRDRKAETELAAERRGMDKYSRDEILEMNRDELVDTGHATDDARERRGAAVFDFVCDARISVSFTAASFKAAQAAWNHFAARIVEDAEEQ